ncbi:D-alanyl-D-alanine carboxypeptidase [Candidatus Phycosocius bacilliformis]|uniref:D-alanyl-D-alanine carboxypeptidase n=1 Tax=Candidatus Phycosocius bacilliformis TaxID=1445552 RepID=A0A2P2EAY4_9PROT|nr:serine hydrolase domain-containing protein [Candidatus Phycosocius bacilliformis]GBF58228.1 D-alanyl-D-alanine carboxypeptidase [Candidatus Phycosocius bacilliformis]
MKRRHLVSVVASLPLLGVLAGRSAAADPAPELVGRWGGVLQAGPTGLRLVLEIPASGLPVLYSLDQGGAPIPAGSGTVSAEGLDVSFPAVRGRMVLKTLGPDVLEGSWTQGGSLKLRLERLSPGQEPKPTESKPFADLALAVLETRVTAKMPALTAGFIAMRDGQNMRRTETKGVCVMGQDQEAKAEMAWHIGSISKSMTATLVARLVARGLLAWDLPLKQAFATLAPDMLPAYRDRTLFDLMTGQTGMPTNLGPFDMLAQAAADSPHEGRKSWVAKALAMTPEKGWVYPNNGYVLAGAVCEAVTGKTYETLMAEEVFGPLKMTTAGFGPPGQGNPQGHRKALIGGKLIGVGTGSGADNPASMAPAGGIHLSLPDLLTYGLAHSRGHAGEMSDYLPTQMWRFLHTPPEGADYALGWLKQQDGTLWHNGSNTYWLAELAFDPGLPAAWASLTNVFAQPGSLDRVMATARAEAMTRFDGD